MKRLFFLLFTLLQAYPLFAQLQWQERNGSFSGNVYALLEAKRGVLVAGTQYGLLRCTDSGNTWILDAGDLRSANISALTMDSVGTIFAATHGIGVYRSADTGRTWQPTSLNNSDALSIAVSPNGTAFAGIYNSGIYYYDSTSASWLSSGLENMRVSAITFLSSDTVIAGTLGAGLQLSTDGGLTWKNEGQPGVDFYCLYVVNDTIYAGTNGGVLRSTNGGHGWAQWGLGNRNIYSFIRGQNNKLWASGYGGIFEQQSNSEQWTNISFNGRIVWSLVMQANTGIITGTDGTGLYRSVDTARSWSCIAQGGNYILVDDGTEPVYTMTVDSSGIYTGIAGSGVLRSTDEGLSWNLVNGETKNLFVWNIAASPWGQIYAETDTGLFVSDDHGKSWEWISDTLFISIWVEQIKFDTQGGVIVLTYGNARDGRPNNIYRSSDRGRSWYLIFSNALSVATASDGSILVSSDSGVFRSIDTGNTWTRWKEPYQTIVNVTLLDSSNALAINDSGIVYKSTDKGRNWIRMKGKIYPIVGQIDPVLMGNGNYLAITTDGNVNVSTDQGNSWSDVYFPYQIMTTLITDPAGHTYIGYCVAGEGGIVDVSMSAPNVVQQSHEAPISFQCFPSFPNPCSTSTQITFSSKKDMQISYSVVNAVGKLINSSHNFAAIEGQNQINIETSFLHTGKYYCIIQAGNDKAISPFYVIR
ncbi:MAG TPA: T9SS type A sorting domain-containing protein [Candidatus Kapabacteria bacterium]|nr:T9SS type A sorting domain-containing protein [Candidatus Kapabacteria bacterium]